MTSVTMEPREAQVMDTVEVRGETLVVNVGKRDKTSLFTPTTRIPLDHVLGAEADPEIERKMWRSWVLRASKPGKYRAPDPEVSFYHPRHHCAHKAIVIRLEDEAFERLVVEVDDPASAVALINEAVGASSRVRRVA